MRRVSSNVVLYIYNRNPLYYPKSRTFECRTLTLRIKLKRMLMRIGKPAGMGGVGGGYGIGGGYGAAAMNGMG